MGNKPGGSVKTKSTSSKSPTSDHDKSGINPIATDHIDDEELTALKLVCISYIDMIEFEIDQIPPKKENEPEPDFEPIFLRLKDYVNKAKRQLGRQELDGGKTIHKEIALPELPMEEPPTPSMQSMNHLASNSEFPDALSAPSYVLCIYNISI